MATALKGYQQYKQQSVSTMTQGELLMMLYDELVKRLTQAELALDKAEYEPFEAAVQRSIDIVTHLSDTLDRQYGISRDLDRLYEYIIYELGRVKLGRHKEPLTHVKTMADDLRQAFRQAQKQADR